MVKQGCPHRRRDQLAVMQRLESMKRLHSDLKEGPVDVIEGEQANERSQQGTIDR